MLLSTNPQIVEAAKGMLEVPFNDFEMYHNPQGTGTVERGGSCVFLTNEFLRRLPEAPELKTIVIETLGQVHYATILEIDGNQYFYDPFLRMEDPVELPQERNQKIDFPGHPQDKVKEISWKLINKTKRGDRRMETHMIKRVNNVHTEDVTHKYRLPFTHVQPIPESDLTFERKTEMKLETLERINGILRTFTFRYRLVFERTPMSAYSSGGPVGHVNHNLDQFKENIEPIRAKLGMTYEEFMQYVAHATETRQALRQARFPDSSAHNQHYKINT